MTETDYIFRIAKQGEGAQILALYQKAKQGQFCVWNDYYPTMTEIRQDLNTHNLYVLAEGDKVIGALSVVPENELDDFSCWLGNNGKEIARVVIDPACQGQGLSLKMVQSIESILREEGYPYIRLSVAKINIPACKTYIKAGFSVVGEAEMYGGSYFLMEKALKSCASV